ncbi:MAG: glycosyltransferase family 4 protein [Bacteroidales bacterium]|nr:glycosyltransferase family 4 protein [Bacteroidales bacterium]
MATDIFIVQRFYYNFREGFFEYLSDKKVNFRLVNSITPRGKVKVHDGAGELDFIVKTPVVHLGNSYVLFPFLFLNLIRHNPRVIITEGGQNTVNNLQILIYSFLFGKRFIIWDLGKGYADFGNSLTRKIYMSFYRLLLRKSSLVYGYHSQSLEYFRSLGVREEKIIVLNNTIDTRKIKSVRSLGTVDNPGEVDQDDKGKYTYLIFVGSLVDNKNIESLAVLMRKLGDKYFLIIVGDGKPAYRQKLEEEFRDVKHIFLGYKKADQLAPYYRLASFSVLPGLGGLSINQSMAYGVPVVCRSADGAEKDLVKNNETGYIYKDIDDAAEFIKSRGAGEWEIMGRKAEKLLYSEHSVESMMGKFISYALIKQ